MTRGRAWIAVLGVLLVGIVALNVATLSFAASSGRIDEQITALEEENSMLESREAKDFSTARIRNEGAAAGLAMPTTEDPRLIEFEPQRRRHRRQPPRGRRGLRQLPPMRLIERRIGLLFGGFLLCFLLIVGRAFWLQGVQGDSLASQASYQQTEVVTSPACAAICSTAAATSSPPPKTRRRSTPPPTR